MQSRVRRCRSARFTLPTGFSGIAARILTDQRKARCATRISGKL